MPPLNIFYFLLTYSRIYSIIILTTKQKEIILLYVVK
nr:MAG TPA: hypothetical protein [Caudoviricetes sp.]